MSVTHHERAFSNELKNRQIISFIAEDADRAIGFITGGYERNGDDIYNGEIYTLYVLKNHQRRGIGAQLVSALARRLNHFGIYSMLVWVLGQNPYRRFYKKVNGIFIRTKQMHFADEMIDVQGYGWIDTSLIYR
jgi:GNAT superfamily N-acetyltransferase